MTPNLVSVKLFSNKDIDSAISLFTGFLGIRSSLNFPHAQCKNLPLHDIFVTLKTRGILACYIKKAADCAPYNSVMLKNGGLTELPPITVSQMVFDSKTEKSVMKEDLIYLYNLLTNRNFTSAHLPNISNGVLHNSQMFQINKEYNKKHIPKCMISKNAEEIRKDKITIALQKICNKY